ncbi:dicarboxylate/amino acid:cation symporter [Arthrobacter sp. MYb211]|uniref:dicarboxylate/amino acid:cation symporter n=1 Tax=Micrococcaceae TaxID=1268 RepID=UPI000BB8FC3C|nr:MULTISPECIES: dicarboxylate/amino acid:cation symporter [Micrococcaceae]PCC28239.1 sodium:proton antiporter [Glutamicibacter sp. BW80]PRA01002.1 dicarboxylate/amino acid:cation symporter [Arthrobacter sp. MYb224]PRA13981.1 dicarboxylate/amino acid:cation symporter [Arthrobacter sp. MYb221]PRC09352.1 dicarboxylate/amino acid:cation symporter [Arthrobacter sp. MYb211]
MNLLKKIPLLGWILVAIVLGILLGPVMPVWLGSAFLTYNSIFSGFLSFIVPLIILGLVMPAIAELGKGAGKWLGVTALIAYSSTVLAGLLAYFVGRWLFTASLSGGGVETLGEDSGSGFEAYISLVTSAGDGATEIVLEPVIGVMSALILAFVIGIGLTAFRSTVLFRGAVEFRTIIEMVIRRIIVPALPLFIFGIFLDLSASGSAVTVVTKFLLVAVVSFALTLVVLLVQYTVAGSMTGQNPLKALWNMRDAYFTALGTSSSAATIPVTLASAKKNGVSDSVAGFVVPLGATIHLSGSMVKITCFSLAVLLLTGGNVSFGAFLPFILMLGVMMIAAPGVPGGAIAAAAGLLAQMLGFGEVEVGLMFAAYIALDSFGTATNVTGDGAIALIMHKLTRGKLGAQAQDPADEQVEVIAGSGKESHTLAE